MSVMSEGRKQDLVARQEALAQAMELMAVSHRLLEERLVHTEARLTQLMEVVNRLVNIADAHEQRLDGPGDSAA
jgi:hypothetical protein